MQNERSILFSPEYKRASIFMVKCLIYIQTRSTSMVAIVNVLDGQRTLTGSCSYTTKLFTGTSKHSGKPLP